MKSPVRFMARGLAEWREDENPGGGQENHRTSGLECDGSGGNGPERFEGRKLGILVSDGSDANILKAIKAALDKSGATFEI
ncbi:MAG: hypothetical protein JSV48_00340, partial [Bradyrhizobium sp.]